MNSVIEKDLTLFQIVEVNHAYPERPESVQSGMEKGLPVGFSRGGEDQSEVSTLQNRHER